MCGICGWLGPDAKEHSGHNLRKMLKAIDHRGPDDSGIYVDNKYGVALGHNRLSIIDLTPGGHQPMVNTNNGDVLTFNGEIYNFRELRRELEAKGYHFRSQSRYRGSASCVCRLGRRVRAAYPWYVRIRDLAPGRARSVSVSRPDGNQAALLLDSTGRRYRVRVGTQGLSRIAGVSTIT